MKGLLIGSRGSPLALWQARWTAAQLADASIEIIKTSGDQMTAAPQAGTSVKGLFTKEIEEALLAGRIQAAVHSLKDLPAEIDARLTIAAIPAREDPRDALVGRRLAELVAGARVGTSSLRRAAQLRHLRPDLRLEDLRGNVDTRLRKLDAGMYDAVVLAAAGLRRLGLEGRIAELLDPEVFCPAPGQGALAIQARADDAETLRRLEALDDPAARAETTAERAMLAELGGGCRTPIGGLARVNGARLVLTGVVASPDGAEVLRATLDGPAADPVELGRRIAADLRGKGADRILAEVYAP